MIYLCERKADIFFCIYYHYYDHILFCNLNPLCFGQICIYTTKYKRLSHTGPLYNLLLPSCGNVLFDIISVFFSYTLYSDQVQLAYICTVLPSACSIPLQRGRRKVQRRGYPSGGKQILQIGNLAYFFLFCGNFVITLVFLQERKHFVVKLKTKSRQPWCSQIKQQQQQQQRREKAGNASRGTSPEAQHETSHKTPDKASTPRVTPLSLATEKFDNGESLGGFQVKRVRTDGHVLRDRNLLDTNKAPKRATQNRKTLCQQEAREAKKKDSTTAAEPQTGVTHTDGQPPTGQTDVEPDSQNILHPLPELISDTDNNSVCHEMKANKRKTEENDHGSVENEMRQRQEEPEGLGVVKSVNVEVEETPSLSDSRAEPPTWQTGDEPEFNERNCTESSSHGDATVRQAKTDSPKSKHKKKKRKKSAAQNVSQEEDRKLESGVRMKKSSVNRDVENSGKKKRRRKEEAAQLQLSPAHVPRTNSTGRIKKSGDGAENTASSKVTPKPSKVKKKKHKKKKKSSRVDATGGGEEVVGVTLCDDASYSPEKNEQVEKSPAKPKNADMVTKKKGELFSRIPSEDGAAQSDESVSVQKKTKKRTSSFLAADVEEKDAQTEGEQNSPPQFTDAHVWGTQNSSVSAGDFEMESAEMAGTLEDSNDRERKKNKKRKRKKSLMEDVVEKDHKRGFKERNKTLPDRTNTGAKRKNKDADLEESTENTCGVVSHEIKDKHLTSPLVPEGNHTHGDDKSRASRTFGRACQETVFEQASPSKTLKDGSPKLSDVSVPNLSFSGYIMKKQKRVKRKLYNYNLSFLTDV